MPNFVNLHTHTEYSQPIDGMSKIEKIIQRVKELGQGAVAICDHGTLSGSLEMYKTAKKNGIKPIMGCEMYFTPDVTIKDRSKSVHMCLYAKDEEGWYNLKKLVTLANIEGYYYDPRIDFDMLKKYHKGLICTTACMGGVLKLDNYLGWAIMLKDLFGDDFYVAVHTNTMIEQKEFNVKSVALAKEIGSKLVAEVDSHYVLKEDAEVHNKWVGVKAPYWTAKNYYLMSEVQTINALTDNNVVMMDTWEAVASTQEIADKCNVEIKFGGHNYPVFKQPDKFKTQLDYVKHLLNIGWKSKLDKTKQADKRYRDRVLHELMILEKADYINYMVISWDLCDWARRSGIRVGVGRGSVGGSLVAFLLGITGLDPVKYNLTFERFVHLERVAPADIDLDFSDKDRQRVIEYVKDKYGTVYQVRTPSYLGDMGAIRKAGELLSIPISMVNEWADKYNSINDMECGVYAINSLEDKCCKLARNILGLSSHFTVHASAVVVFPDDPCNYTAIEMQGGKDGTQVVSTNMKYIEEMGCLKQDILGLKTLGVIDECLKLANLPIDFVDNLPDTDAKTFEMLQAGHTSGCFQIESSGMTQLVIDLIPKEFTDLIPLVALYRPACIKNGMVKQFIEARAGRLPVEYPYHTLEDILKHTYGVILYQEQIMKICQVLAGYTLGQADMLRRAIGKKNLVAMANEEKGFKAGCLANRIPQERIDYIWLLIQKFAEYGFNESHSASYAMIAYQTAYLKAHYPLEYMCALLNSEIGDMEKQGEYVGEARRMGIIVLPVDIHNSKHNWTINGNGLRIGFNCIKGVGKISVNPNYPSLYDFLLGNTHLNMRELSALNKVGAFDYLCKSYKFNWQVLEWWNGVNSKIANCDKMIIEWGDRGNDKKVTEWTVKRLNYLTLTFIGEIPPEQPDIYDLLGFRMEDVSKTYDLRMHNGNNILIGEVMSTTFIVDKNGDNMAFIKIRTIQNKVVELVMFAYVYKKIMPITITKGQYYTFKVKDGTKLQDMVSTKKL